VWHLYPFYYNTPEQRRSHQHGSGSLKSWLKRKESVLYSCTTCITQLEHLLVRHPLVRSLCSTQTYKNTPRPLNSCAFQIEGSRSVTPWNWRHFITSQKTHAFKDRRAIERSWSLLPRLLLFIRKVLSLQFWTLPKVFCKHFSHSHPLSHGFPIRLPRSHL
jgi:hypothetical protein